jgi:hypothetical protein
MRQTIKGLIAALTVMTAGAAPAMACGYNPCATYAPAYTYTPAYSYTYGSGCGACGNSWGYGRLAEPTTQYYYVNQGPTYSGPGAFAPEPAYEETAIPSYGTRSYSGYEEPSTYGYGYQQHYRPYRQSYHYGYAPRHYGYRYGYNPHRYSSYRYGREGMYYGHPLVRRYY